MSGPIVSLSTLEKIVPEHCRPLWRNDTNLMVISKCAREKECGDTHAGRKKTGGEEVSRCQWFITAVFRSIFSSSRLWLLNNYNRFLFASWIKSLLGLYCSQSSWVKCEDLKKPSLQVWIWWHIIVPEYCEKNMITFVKGLNNESLEIRRHSFRRCHALHLHWGHLGDTFVQSDFQ